MGLLIFHKDKQTVSLQADVEGDAKKITQMFFHMVFVILMIRLFCVYIIKVDTLTIPKW